MLGGLTDTGAGSARVEVYDPATNSWTNAAPLPEQRHHIGVATLGGALYSVGGFAGASFSPTNDVYRFDPARNEWTAVASLPAPRGALAVVQMYGLLYAVGGSTASGTITDNTLYDPETNEWSFVTNLPTPRNHLAAVALNGYMYVIGGRADGGGNANTGELDRYDPIENRWDVLAPMPTARSGHAAAVLDGRIVVMGGEVNPDNPPNGVFVEVEVYDPSADRLDDARSNGRYHATASVPSLSAISSTFPAAPPMRGSAPRITSMRCGSPGEGQRSLSDQRGARFSTNAHMPSCASAASAFMLITSLA